MSDTERTPEGRVSSSGAAKQEARRQAVEGWPLIESNRQRDAIQKWVRYGDMSQVDDPHYTLIHQWEAQHGVL